mgnify:CR=1 FL=1
MSRAIETFGDLSRVTTIATAMGRWLWFGGATVVGTLPLVAAYAIASGSWAHRRRQTQPTARLPISRKST